MEQGMFVFGIILLVITVLSILYAGFLKKRHEQEIVRTIAGFANQHNCTISEYDYWGRYCIAVDTLNEMLFFFDNVKEPDMAIALKFAELKGCRVVNHGRVIGENTKVTDALQLVLAPSKTGQKEVVLEFYNVNNSLQVHDELLLIEKWSKIINRFLSK